jgi:hypothetical protein
MVYACNPSTGSLRQEDWEFNDSLGYIARPYLYKKKSKLLKTATVYWV